MAAKNTVFSTRMELHLLSGVLKRPPGVLSLETHHRNFPGLKAICGVLPSVQAAESTSAGFFKTMGATVFSV